MTVPVMWHFQTAGGSGQKLGAGVKMRLANLDDGRSALDSPHTPS